MTSCLKEQNNPTPDFDLLLGEKPSQSFKEPPQKRYKRMVISRQALKSTIDSGFGRFLGNIEVDPHFYQDQFAGWKILRTPYASFDMRPGDIVKSVNGSSVERPNQAFELWESLAKANTIAFVIERRGEAIELTLDVADLEDTSL